MEKKEETQPVKPKNIFSLIGFILAHFILFGSVSLPIYALITQNYYLLAFLAIIVVIQLVAKKSKIFVNFITKYIPPSQAFNSFQVIDDWQESNKKQSHLEKTIYAFHPHSIFAMCFLSSMNLPSQPAFCNMVGMSSMAIYFVPFAGLILKLWGVEEASNKNFKRLLKQGRNIGLLPGAFEQSTVTSPDEIRCWVNRKGFIKYALEYNYAIRPVIVLRQHQGFWTVNAFEGFRLLLNKFKMPGAVFWNRQFGIVQPTNLDIAIIKGRPINRSQDKKGFEPSKDLVDQVHKEYVEQIQRLYSKYQSLNGNKPLKFY